MTGSKRTRSISNIGRSNKTANGGNGQGGGNSNSGGGVESDPAADRSRYAMGREHIGTGYVSVGTDGAIHKASHGKTTLHPDGKHHQHGIHSTNPKKGSFVSSDKLYSSKYQGLFGSLSAMFERIKKKK